LVRTSPPATLFAPDQPAPPDPEAAPPKHSREFDLGVLAAALLLAAWITNGLLRNPNHTVVDVNRGDQALFEWLLAYSAHSLTHFQNPLWTTLLNAPDGVNLAANTSVVLIGWLFAPLTLLAGASVSYVVILTLNLAATAYAWYYAVSRHLTRSRVAAVVAGLFCGFAPGMVSHANGHLNFTGQFLVPLIIWRLLALRNGRSLRNGAILGLLLAIQWSVGAEVMFFTALGTGVFCVAWALQNRRSAASIGKPFAKGLAAAGTVSLTLMSYPLFLMFAGPQRYHGTGFDQRVHAEDMLAYVAFPKLSLAGQLGLATHLAPNPTEENSFFGWPLVLLAIACTILLWRNTIARSMAITAAVFVVLSWGPRAKINGGFTDAPLPYLPLSKLPFFNSALPARLALIVIPIIGLLLALAIDRVSAMSLTGKAGWFAAFAAALLPLAPMPVPATQRAPVPHFFSSGAWREYVHGGSVVAVPPTSDLYPDGQRWQTTAFVAGQQFPIVGGFFLGPGGPDGRGQIGPIRRPTASMLEQVTSTGTVPVLTSIDREQAKADLAYWHADLVVLSDGGAGISWTPHHDALLDAVSQLLGPPQRVDDVWLWPVRR
jgi:hypothetical protein